jgi:ribosome-associated protein
MSAERDEQSASEEEDLTSRSDIKRARKTREDALSRLAKSLCALTPTQLERLELPDPVLEAIFLAQSIKAHSPKNRQLRVVRSQLRGENWPSIVVRLEQLQKHGRVSSSSSGDQSDAEARSWLVRLLGEGSVALDELLEAHPELDRKHIRTLVRNVQNSSAQRRTRAEEKLARTLEHALR